MRTSQISLSALALIAAIATSARADERATSDKIFKDGITAYARKDYEGARTMFAAAYADYPSPNSLFNLARVEQVLDRHMEAYRHFRAYSELPDNPRITPPERAEAKVRMGESLAKLGRIVVLAPQGARVVLDGAPQDNTAESFPVTPGRHSVDFVLNDQTRKRTVVCQAGEVHQAKWDDDSKAAPPISARAGVPREEGVNAPNDPFGGAPSRSSEGGSSAQTLLKVGLIVGGAGALGIVGGFTFGALSSGSADEARSKAAAGVCVDPASAVCAGVQSSVDSANTLHTASTASFIAGGILLAGGLTLVTVGVMKKADLSRRSQLVPMVGQGGIGLGWHGKF